MRHRGYCESIKTQCAKGRLVLLGHKGGEGGESTHWGDILIGKNKALVEVDTVLAGGVKLPFKKKEWGPLEYTFQHLEKTEDKEIAVWASQLVLQLRQEREYTQRNLHGQALTTLCNVNGVAPATAIVAETEINCQNAEQRPAAST